MKLINPQVFLSRIGIKSLNLMQSLARSLDNAIHLVRSVGMDVENVIAADDGGMP